MNRVLVILFFTFIFSNEIQAQTAWAFRVQFKNKNGSLTIADSALFLSQKAFDRRQKNGIKVDSTDVPVSPIYIDSVMSVSQAIKLHNKSKWFNQIVVITYDSTKSIAIQNLAFVNKVELVARYNNFSLKTNQNMDILSARKFPKVTYPQNKKRGSPSFYNHAFQQINIMQGDYLHDMGFWGDGMTIGVLDAGFLGANTFSAFDSMNNANRLLYTYNFVKDTTFVYYNNSDHGMNALSCMAAEWVDTFVGTAPKASFYCLVTEDVSSEKPIEEDNWISGAEFCDSAGVDLINSSLGYNEFTNPTFSYSYQNDFDGKTTLISKGANMAVSKGIFVVASQGNEGGASWHYLLTPADADSVYAVGMVDGSGIWGGSGYGPSADGQIKPDGSGMGKGASLIGGNGGQVGTSNGSSFSAPMLCGSIACLWQAVPSLKVWEIRSIVWSVSNKYTMPDSLVGYGVPNFRLAYQVALESKDENYIAKETILYPNPMTSSFHISTDFKNLPYDIEIYDYLGRKIFEEKDIKAIHYYNGILSDRTQGNYIVHINSKKQKQNFILTKQ